MKVLFTYLDRVCWAVIICWMLGVFYYGGSFRIGPAQAPILEIDFHGLQKIIRELQAERRARRDIFAAYRQDYLKLEYEQEIEQAHAPGGILPRERWDYYCQAYVRLYDEACQKLDARKKGQPEPAEIVG